MQLTAAPAERPTAITRPVRVAVVMVHWHSEALLAQSLASLALQTQPPDRVLVVDNGSEPGRLDAVRRQYSQVEWIEPGTNLGFAAANNLAVRAASNCDWVALLNTDAFVEPDWLAHLLTAAADAPQFASFGSRLLCADDPERVDGTGDVYHVSGLAWRRDHGHRATASPVSEEIFAPCAAAALYRRDAFLEVGGFDEQFFCYHEDVDLGFRLRLAGFRARYVPQAVVRHVGSATTGAKSDFMVYHGHRNLVWTFVKNMPAALLWWTLPQHLLLNVVALSYFTLRGQGRTVLRAKWDALRGLPQALRARRKVQASRRATTRQLREMMATGLLKPYWKGAP